jgi:hypothetical protein
MRKEAVRYWDEVAAQDLPAVRDAMLAGFRSERASVPRPSAVQRAPADPTVTEDAHVLSPAQ